VKQYLAINSLSIILFLLIVNGVFSSMVFADEPQRELLWPNGAPGEKGDKPDDKPTLTIFLPEKSKATGTAVVICPGGGYGHLSVDLEGKQIAEWLNSLGVAGFVLEYRHQGRGYGHPAPLQDAQRAIRTVRAKADQWNVNPSHIGIMGFSAGGHLASTAGTHFDKGDSQAADPIEKVSCRPDFMILCYAVIAFGEPYTHRGSQTNLIGKDAPDELVKSLSNEKQVTPDTPPTFLFHTDEDKTVPSENSIQFYLALHKAKVPAELHIYRKGGHGTGLAQKIPGTSNWPKACEEWLRGQKLLEDRDNTLTKQNGDLIFVGTVKKIELSPQENALANWVVIFQVEKVKSGNFKGTSFSFGIHSPSQSGLEVAKSYTVKAEKIDSGYKVDPYQWMQSESK
jgi:acetyl esterase/lipase